MPGPDRRGLIYYPVTMKFYKDPFILKLIALLFAIKLIFLAYVCFLNPLGNSLFVFPDTPGYLIPAQTLRQYGSLLEANTLLPMTLRTPGYPLFLFLFYVLPGSALGAVCAQLILSSLIPAAVYQTAGLWTSRRAARGAAVLSALSVLYFVYSFALLSEILCAFLLAWSVYFTAEFLAGKHTRDLFYASALLALSVTVRPAGYAFIGVSGLLLAAYWTFKKVKLSACIAGFLLPVILIIGGWQLRNKWQTGFGGFTSFSAFQTYIWNADAYAARFGLTNQEADRLLRTERPQGFAAWPLAKQQQWLVKQGRALTLQSLPYKLPRLPFWAAKTLLGNNFVFSTQLLFGRPEPGAQTDSRLMNAAVPARGYIQNAQDAAVFALTFLQIFLLVCMAALGWRQAFLRMPRAAWVFLTAYTAYFWMAGSSFFGAQSRYRAPFEFTLCIFGAFALERLYTRFRRGKQ